MKSVMHLVLIVLISISSAHAAEQVFVSSKKVKLYSDPSYKADAVAGLKKGDSLSVLSTEGNWLEVKYEAIDGWVPRYSVSETEPPKKVSFFSRIKSFFSSDSSRARVSTISTAGGVRGLAEGETESSGDKDYGSVEKMEQMSVTDQEVETFIEGNKP